MILKHMNHADCMTLLRKARLGRLACASEGQPYVVPITYAADGNDLYGFSLLGQKVEWMRTNPKVCVQVDEFHEGDGWTSVVAYGRYEELPDRIGSKIRRERAWSLLSQHADWWEPGGLKPVSEPPAQHLFYRIVVETVSGRQARPDE
jgi:nitroimidazol reductase NimA-like FMN-containing flavoprotein (pyridoxamine 5'-phosphate oxidase superfamily)